MLKQTAFFLAAATMLTACATAPGGLQRATPPAHATGEGLGRPAGATGAAPVTAPEAASKHRHH